MPMGWTDWQDLKCREMASRYSASIIGDTIGRSRNAVIGYCHRNNIQLAKNTDRHERPRGHYQRRNVRRRIEAIIDVGGVRARITPPEPKFKPLDRFCTWITGEPRNGVVCGLPASGSFCPEHARIVYK